ncbi:conserved protein of unknown function [Candidatus Filomicrobium marinum]|uniref:EAL domain-containing protein n=2 Tax=Candidatus Filomicrobium marinum TaxID=1608628 RepID=A0A0D6JA39_9HYPH|nr:EAL domain-containing protein [Candidatus Filomicrobium marinum]CFW99651.1 conserved protein of unknown function [Candidatus Filomicrobium marinum]CPR15088.1 conserved protein of unknown function [Candidatus Filomicrobium marinum]
MEVTQQGRRTRPAGKGRFAEALVLVSMALFTFALGTAAHLHGGLDVWTSLTMSVVILICLMALHAIVRGRRAVYAMKSQISQLEDQIEQLGANSVDGSRNANPRFSAKPVGSPPRLRRRGDGAPVDRPEFGTADFALPEFASRPEPRRDSPGHGVRGHQPVVPPPLSADLAKPPPMRNSPSLSSDDGKSRAAGSSDLAASTPAVRAREGDVEMLQAMIKKLADEVNAAEAANGGFGRWRSEGAVNQSVDALKSAANSMRSTDQPVRGGAPAGREVRIQSIKDALVAGRVDVLLEPILTLKDRKPRHFEVSLRLRDERGDVLDVYDDRDGYAGRAILPIIDRVNIERTSQVALQLECRGRQGSLFSKISGESLNADKFLDGVENAYRARENFSGQLVMTFSQADVRAFGERERATLADLASLGFRYAIGSVTDLDMDFAELKAIGFDFAKLDASVFLDGLMAGETLIPARDICRHLADIGLTLVVGRIDDEQVAARIFGFGVLFGQGHMFGGPRPVKRGALESGKNGHVAA